MIHPETVFVFSALPVKNIGGRNNEENTRLGICFCSLL